MSREIKFRAWDIADKRMMYRGVFDRNWYGTPKNDENGCNCIRGITPEDRSIIKLMQYIGLKDKNGVEIYEGDIVEFDKFHKKLIKFEEYRDCECSFTGYDIIAEESAKCTVIGNIYENSDMLIK